MATPDALPTLEARPKGEWRGFYARALGALVALGLALGLSVAETFLRRYHTTIGRTIYVAIDHPGELHPSVWLHEGVHAWQESTTRFYKLRYILSRRWRTRLEAQAYAAEVVAEYRSEIGAASSLAAPMYWLGLDNAAASEHIRDAVKAWADAGHDRESMRALGLTARG